MYRPHRVGFVFLACALALTACGRTALDGDGSDGRSTRDAGADTGGCEGADCVEICDNGLDDDGDGRGGAGSGPEAARLTRTPSGHPEGYLEGFANIYSEVAQAIRAARTDSDPGPEVVFPTVEDGLVGMQFIEAALKSSEKGATWVKV